MQATLTDLQQNWIQMLLPSVFLELTCPCVLYQPWLTHVHITLVTIDDRVLWNVINSFIFCEGT